MAKLSKKQFMEKYGYSRSTYQRRMTMLKATPIFCDAYEMVTKKEVTIDTELYDKFRSYLAHNRLRTRKTSPEQFLNLTKGGTQ
ncbi:MAG: hypothetical protein ACTIOL_09265 [Enterococcus sp.]